MKTNSRMSEEAVPNPGGGGTSEVRSRAELEVGESEHCLAQGQAWCLDFISRISIDCHDHSEVEKTTALTPPRPFREERYWVGWGGCPCRPLWVPLHLGMAGCPYHLSHPRPGQFLCVFPFSTGGCWCKRCRSDAINQEDMTTWLKLCPPREGAVWDPSGCKSWAHISVTPLL